MNEFIVWDKKSKKFRVVSNIVYDTSGIYDINKKDIGIKLVNLWGQPFNDDGEQNPNILVQREPKHFTIHNYIGKTDIEGKKIYADCSIVELKLYRMDTAVLGYFHFNKKTMRIEFEQYFEKRKEFLGCYVSPEEYESLKVIGTLQEDKELL